MQPAIPMMRKLKPVRRIFRFEDRYLPLFMKSQNTALIPSILELAGYGMS